MVKLRRLAGMFLMVSALCSGCSEGFLDETNPQSVGFDHIKDLKSLTAATTGVYNSFNNSNYYGRTFVVSPELFGDNSFISIRNGGRYLGHDRFTVTNGDGYVTGAWTQMNRVVANANLAIQAGNQLTFPEGQRAAANQIMGELYACRALAWFDMVRYFAQPYNYTEDASHLGIPLVTEPPGVIISPSRGTVAEAYTHIVADLLRAEELLGSAKKNGYFNKAGAQALLAKVYLYMEDWENAEIYATKVIEESAGYTLLSNADYVASWGQKFSVESILEIGMLPTDNNGANSIGYLSEQGGYGEWLATKELYDTYSQTDIRRNLIVPGSRENAESEAYFIKKYPLGASSRDDNIKVLRLSEVYLIRAEARAELSKTQPDKAAGALSDLNAIVGRADPEASVSGLQGDALVERIILERRKELAFEGNRLFDINRKKMSLVHIQTNQIRTFEYPNNRFIMPIPYAERNANPNIQPNPGWN
ncbi:SusD family protein [Parapedobacter composti]|uniref:SusD family protein n=2 Tax=Parapedobacter composti TaxID=623281 RepID=A0A1I1L1A5_9SPHI|nr:SusD family protein [Parapedobacter composti]